MRGTENTFGDRRKQAKRRVAIKRQLRAHGFDTKEIPAHLLQDTRYLRNLRRAILFRG